MKPSGTLTAGSSGWAALTIWAAEVKFSLIKVTKYSPAAITMRPTMNDLTTLPFV
ncbi:MAG: hypothetical protein MJZ41_16160 [Bacteroidaceae bacterium]|nr:hypothetical protein [Bacteroidaceae bacterium]